MKLQETRRFVYVGTYTGGDEQGIYIFSLDEATGGLSPVGAVGGGPNPSFLTIHPNGRFLYCVNETDSYEGTGGALAAYAIDSGGAHLTLLNRQPTLGVGPCHVSVDKTGSLAFVSHYGGGALTTLPVRPDGSVGSPIDYLQYDAVGDDVTQPRKVPHVHSALLDPAGRLLVVADLGLDRLLMYELDAGNRKIRPHSTSSVSCRPSSGPRHFVFHPCGRYLYLINELDSTISVFGYETGQVGTELQAVSTLPAGFAGTNWCADIHVHPNGRFLYGSNRGHDSLATFAVGFDNGLLSEVDHVTTGGTWPRSFVLNSSGTMLLAANERSDSVVSYWVNSETGMLQPTGHVATVPNPACVLVGPSIR